MKIKLHVDTTQFYDGYKETLYIYNSTVPNNKGNFS